MLRTERNLSGEYPKSAFPKRSHLFAFNRVSVFTSCGSWGLTSAYNQSDTIWVHSVCSSQPSCNQRAASFRLEKLGKVWWGFMALEFMAIRIQAL